MSKLATVSVVQCDHCGKVVVLASEPQWKTFEETWSDGPMHDFCPLCRERDDVKRIIESDEQAWLAALAHYDLQAKKPKQEKAEYGH